MRIPTSSVRVVAGIAALALMVCRQANVLACYLYGTDYDGYDVNKYYSGVAVEGPQNCQDACQANPFCSHWTYVTAPKQCYLKASNATLGATHNPIAVSGPKLCPSRQTCFEYGTDYIGVDVDKLESGTVDSAEACQSICLWRAGCHFWTFIPSKRDCYLKDESASQGRHSHAEAISGPKRCP